MLIDVHTHIVPERLPDFSNRPGGARWPTMEPAGPGCCRVMIAGENFRTVTDQCWSLERRLEDMEREGVERQVISPMPKLFSYGFEPRDTLDFCHYVNEEVLRLVNAAAGRFHGLAQAPLQDPELAARELAPLKAQGFHGVEIGSNVDGRSLADPMFLPFFAEAEAQDMPLFVHALDPSGRERFIGSRFLENLIGFPQENTLAASTLITGGVIERHPGLRVLFSHGGSGFGIVLPRLDQGWRTMEHFLPRIPSSYIANFYFDTLLFDPIVIGFQIEKFGADRLMVGSDYPFIIREIPPGKAVNEIHDLSEAERTALHSRTCLEFLGLEA